MLEILNSQSENPILNIEPVVVLTSKQGALLPGNYYYIPQFEDGCVYFEEKLGSDWQVIDHQALRYSTMNSKELQ